MTSAANPTAASRAVGRATVAVRVSGPSGPARLSDSAGQSGSAGSLSSAGMATASGTTVHFTQAARLLAREARARGLAAPGFRCPPRIVGVQRTLRRHPAGGVVIAVQVRGRPWIAVVADMIEGVVVANRLTPPTADRVRTELWQAIGLEWPTDLPKVA